MIEPKDFVPARKTARLLGSGPSSLTPSGNVAELVLDPSQVSVVIVSVNPAFKNDASSSVLDDDRG